MKTNLQQQENISLPKYIFDNPLWVMSSVLVFLIIIITLLFFHTLEYQNSFLNDNAFVYSEAAEETIHKQLYASEAQLYALIESLKQKHRDFTANSSSRPVQFAEQLKEFLPLFMNANPQYENLLIADSFDNPLLMLNRQGDFFVNDGQPLTSDVFNADYYQSLLAASKAQAFFISPLREIADAGGRSSYYIDIVAPLPVNLFSTAPPIGKLALRRKIELNNLPVEPLLARDFYQQARCYLIDDWRNSRFSHIDLPTQWQPDNTYIFDAESTISASNTVTDQSISTQEKLDGLLLLKKIELSDHFSGHIIEDGQSTRISSTHNRDWYFLLNVPESVYIRQKNNLFGQLSNIFISISVILALLYIFLRKKFNLYRIDIKKLYMDANYDSITSLISRTRFMNTARNVFEQTKKKNSSFSLLFIDIDNFKMINDTYSHQFGDYVLKIGGQRFRDCIRSTDYVSRIGGDEFLILLDDISTDEQACQVAYKLLNIMNEEIFDGHDRALARISIGIALYHPKDTNIEGAIIRADHALYAAKREGRNRYSLLTYDQALEEGKTDRRQR